MSTSKAKRSRRDGADGDGAKRVKVISPSSSFVHHEPPINQPLALEYLCPITRELPVDPVMAEDGRIYERSAIEKHFITCQSRNIQDRASQWPVLQSGKHISAAGKNGSWSFGKRGNGCL